MPHGGAPNPAGLGQPVDDAFVHDCNSDHCCDEAKHDTSDCFLHVSLPVKLNPHTEGAQYCMVSHRQGRDRLSAECR